ncbi:TCR/Tet family MFS transporter [Pelagibacterium lentulum]|uniref:Tetracycline resistance MFS efflux pump n=1 Tax=Pelagibacterium lentulum TaxID=2029865 RepID=A0A916RLN7_9HYPH|nr:TCR/Tet family MFS transporter [Pelagibacterium lentulum]GGA60892.1 tetracycline resistance MFS efflux pump [Pelagibacterium lentulum]
MRVKPQSRLTLVFILITVFLDIVGLGIIIPVLPNLILELTGETVTNAAVIGGYLIFVYASMQFFFSPILGNLSDRWGRRPILLLSLVGLSADYLLMAWAPTLAWLFVGRVLSGICGAAIGTATAYVADITPKEKRSQRFGLIGAAFGLGFIVGPFIGGELGEFGPRAPFYVAAFVAAANVVFGFFVLPESLSKFRRRRFNLKRANPLGAIMAFRQTPIVIILLGALFLFALAGQTYPNVWNFFTIKQFDWSPSQVGRSLGIFGVLFAFSQAVLIGPSIKYLGVGRTVLLGMGLAMVAFIGVSLVESVTMLWVFLVIGSFSGIAVPAINGLLANNVKKNQQGELQGAVNATNSLTAIIAPVAATQLFAYFTTPEAPVFFPGVPFFAAGILIGLSAMTFLYAGWRYRQEQKPYREDRKPPAMTPPVGQAVNPPDPDNPDGDYERNSGNGENDNNNQNGNNDKPPSGQ